MRRAALWLAALVLGVVLVAAAPAAAPARTQATHTAGVTVSFGPGHVVRRTVTFTGDSISGIDTLRAAGFSIEVYGYGGLGAAVCRIDGVGRPADSACLNGGSQYWAYFRNGAYSIIGAGASEVHDHDQEQWAWGSGDKAPPTTTFGVPTTSRPTTTTSAGPRPSVGGSTKPVDPGSSGVSSTTAAGSSTTTGSTSSSTGSTSPTTADGSSTTSRPRGGQTAAGDVTPTSTSGGDGGGGGPLAMAGFAVVLAAVLGLTLRARSARGTEASRN